jgi:hypothetical protein
MAAHHTAALVYERAASRHERESVRTTGAEAERHAARARALRAEATDERAARREEARQVHRPAG